MNETQQQPQSQQQPQPDAQQEPTATPEPTTIEEATGFPDEGGGDQNTGQPNRAEQIDAIRAENEALKRELGQKRAQEGANTPAPQNQENTGQQGFPETPAPAQQGTPPAPQEGTPAPAPQGAPQNVVQDGFPEAPAAQGQQQGQPQPQRNEGTTESDDIAFLQRENQVNRFFLDNAHDESLTPEIKQNIRQMVMDRNIGVEDAAKIAMYDAGYAHTDQAAGRANPGESFADRTMGERRQSVEEMQKNKSAHEKREEGNQAIRNELVGDNAKGKISFGN